MRWGKFRVDVDITVVPSAHNDQQRGVSIRWLGEAQSNEIGHVAGAGKPLTEVVFINPFGGQLLLEVEGYLPKLTRVAPFLGATVVVERDLQALPTLLFRPTVEVKSRRVGGDQGSDCRSEGHDDSETICPGSPSGGGTAGDGFRAPYGSFLLLGTPAALHDRTETRGRIAVAGGRGRVARRRGSRQRFASAER